MKIISTKKLSLPGVKIIKFERFYDHRGYFAETYNKEHLAQSLGWEVVQINESLSKPNVVRGLHFQWNPYMGKLIRTVKSGRMAIFINGNRANPARFSDKPETTLNQVSESGVKAISAKTIVSTAPSEKAKFLRGIKFFFSSPINAITTSW